MNRKATLITFGMREYGKARDVPKEFTQIRLDFKGHSLFSSVQFSVTWMGQGMLLLLQHISCCHQAEELEVSTWIADANKLLVNSIYFWRKAPKKHSQSITKPHISEDTALLTLISLFLLWPPAGVQKHSWRHFHGLQLAPDFNTCHLSSTPLLACPKTQPADFSPSTSADDFWFPEKTSPASATHARKFAEESWAGSSSHK